MLSLLYFPVKASISTLKNIHISVCVHFGKLSVRYFWKIYFFVFASGGWACQLRRWVSLSNPAHKIWKMVKTRFRFSELSLFLDVAWIDANQSIFLKNRKALNAWSAKIFLSTKNKILGAFQWTVGLSNRPFYPETVSMQFEKQWPFFLFLWQGLIKCVVGR